MGGRFAFRVLAAHIAAVCVPVLPSAATAQEGQVMEHVVVTGSRVTAVSGFTAPTPVTTLQREELNQSAPVTITEALLQMPQFATASQPQTGQSFANLRSIGAQRTLTLVDGRRHVATFSDSTVDLNVIPTTLVQRTEVVTGGASASWGSDAVAGVVNLILDTDLEGFRSSLQLGQSKYDDDESLLVSVGGGTGFANGRGHIVAGAEFTDQKGIRGTQPPYKSRPWGRRGSVGNSGFADPNHPGYGQPGLIYADDVRRSNVAPGGLITGGPLRGIEFLPNGQTREFGYGELYGNYMIGGSQNEWESAAPGGDSSYPVERTSFLTHIKYDLTDSLRVFTELSYARSISKGEAVPGRNNGAAGNVQCDRTGYTTSNLGNIGVSIDNAFLPEHIRQAMIDADVTCIPFGRSFRDPGMGNFRTNDGAPKVLRAVFGAEGELGRGWTWDAYVQHGESEFQQRRIGNIHSIRFNNAVDAVFDGEGNIVCRINIDADPTNDDPRCVPFNMFGEGSPSQPAIDYVTGTSMLDIDMSQTVVAFSVDGVPFSTWAGDVGFTTGVEYREDDLKAVVDEDSLNDIWQTTNRKPSEGSVDVKELFVEAVVPLTDGAPLAQRLDLQVAGRYADYSSSGGVTTWKVGLNWEVNDQVRVRATQSRDIRAGNIGELFTPSSVQVATNLVDRVTGERVNPTIHTTGNPTLDPENADTFTAGIVYQPRWAEGLSMSVDYYSIDVTDAIAYLSEQNVLDECQLRNNPTYCAAIDRDANGTIINMRRQYRNLDMYKNRGVDLEVAYTKPIGPGDLRLRALGMRLLEDSTTAYLGSGKDDQVGEFTTPEWRTYLFATYALDRFSGTVDWRWYSGGVLDNTRVYGLAAPNGTNVDKLGSIHYTNLTLNWEPQLFGARDASVFLRVNNVFDKQPPFPLTGGAVVDTVGRAYRVGLRVGF